MKKLRISRAKFENISYLTFNGVNIITYFMVSVASILKAKQGTLADIIQAIYCTIISSLLILHEFSSPAWTQLYLGFLTLHRGKSLLMIFLGCWVMCEIGFNIIVSLFTFSLGICYFLLSLIPSLPPPSGFLVHWQNHKDFWAEGLDLRPPTSTEITSIPPRIQISNVPHPSAWHPASGLHVTALSEAASFHQHVPKYNMDYSKFQNHFANKPKDTTRLYVNY